MEDGKGEEDKMEGKVKVVEDMISKLQKMFCRGDILCYYGETLHWTCQKI